MCGEEFLVAREKLVEDGIGLVAVALDIDEENEALHLGVDAPFVGAYALGERLEVERLEGAVLA
jgi:hypothetical protein